MIQIIPTAKEPTYEELKETCAWLKGRLKEARRDCREALKWRTALLLTSAVSTTLLALTWGGYINL
ncbi:MULTISPECIES: hypothetical protein [Clostridium]|uniref:Uncharacterized protein n=1 Tax=Clostridium porci TaxID=2605778 RepID=A0A7X2TC90_9CLOT|nr:MULTISPECIES: hypothetical protein [Clostridium]MCI6140252.1 hypothetical protein [Clostridium sp.]MDU3369550.1 hypothetical protein [Clostridioides difficile]MSS36637.1 hypothetical protein [Clostridium porci]